MTDPLRQLTDEGVAIWLDDMSRHRLVSGNLKALVRDRHVVGVNAEARQVLADLADLGVDYDDVVRGLEADGVEKFKASWTELLDDVQTAMAGHRSRRERTP